MAFATFTWKHLIPFTSIAGKIAERLSRLASWLTRGRGEADDERTTSADAAPSQNDGARDEKDALAQAIAHLEYLGYEVGPPDPDGWSFARHPLRYDFHLRAFPWGIRLHCAVRPAVGKSRSERLEYLNTANARSHITHFSLFQDPWGASVVRMCALASLPYHREAFAIVMDMWHDDLDWIRHNRDVPVSTAVEADEEEEEQAVTLH